MERAPEWLLVLQLLTGEVAELPASKADCYGTLDIASRTGFAVFTLSDKRVVRLPAFNIMCVTIGEQAP